MMPRLTLRARLMLWYSLVFSTTLFSLGFVSLWMVHRAIDDLEQNELQQRVRSVRRFLESRPKDEPFAQTRAAMTAADDVSHGNKWLQVIDEHGNWLYRSPHVASVYPQLVLPAQIPQAGRYFNYVTESIPVRAFIAPITVKGVHYTVQTGLTLTKTLSVLSSFGTQLAIFTTLGLIISSLAGYFMSRKALTPIAMIAAEAQRINDKNLNVRLPEMQTRDELASLTNTLNQMLGRIEAGYQSIRSFTSNAAHELRSPVALLRAETEVALAFPRETDYYRNTCEHILQNSIQMTRLIDQLLTLARNDAGVDSLKFGPVNLPDLLNETSEEWRMQFEAAGIHFRTEIGMKDFWVNADFAALKRLLNILLENAWRYTMAGKSVSVLLLQSDISKTAQVSIVDTGVGVAPENQKRIFERFFRSARPIHGDFAGSGLGLALGQWIAERHQSVIQYENNPDGGSIFSFRLPSNVAITETPLIEHANFAAPSQS